MMVTEEEERLEQEEIDALKTINVKGKSEKEKGVIAGALIAAGVVALTKKVPTTPVKTGHSGTEKILKGNPYLQSGDNQGKVIKEIIKKDWDSKRVVKFTDGSKVDSSKKIIRAHMDVELDRQYKPKALKTLTVAKDGTAKVKLAGVKQGTVVKYANKTNALRAVDNYYSEDYGKYLDQRYPKLCRKGSHIIQSAR